MKIFKILLVSIDFSTNLLIILLDSGGGGSAPRTPTNAYFQNFFKISHKFSKKISIQF